MQKIVLVFSLVFLFSGCSVFNRPERNIFTDESVVKSGSGDQYIRERNLTENAFYIKSMDIEYTDGKTESNFEGSIRFEKPDKYLIALRSKTGIELARIFLNGDSIFVLDRLKHIVYKGPLKYVKKNYGFPVELLPVMLGDFVGKCKIIDERENKEKIVNVKCFMPEVALEYQLDRGKGKVVSSRVETRLGNDVSTISYEKFKKENGAFFPGKIVMINDARKVSVVLKIRKIQYPWNEKMEFNIGKRYEIIELL